MADAIGWLNYVMLVCRLHHINDPTPWVCKNILNCGCLKGRNGLLKDMSKLFRSILICSYGKLTFN